MLGLPSARLLQALAKPQLSDSDIQDYLDCLEAQAAAPGSARAPTSSLAAAGARPLPRPARDGGMRLSSRVQEIVVSEGRCTPRECDLLAGGRVLIRVQGGPPQPFAIGRDVEDAVVTPAIPAGTTYEWTPPEPGRYFVRSEVYPSLRSEIRVLRPSDTAEAVGTASTSSASTAFSRFGSMSAVDEFVPFPALKAAGTGSYSRGTQTGGSSFARHAGAFNPGPVLGRFQADSLGPDEEDSDDEGGGFVAPPAAGLRRRGHAAGTAPQQQQQQAVSGRGALPDLGRPAAPAGLDGFSVVSGGSGGSPRSGSGSERSTSSAPLYVERRRVPGMLQSTYSAVHSGRSSYSDSRSGASEERQPLLYSVGGQAGYTASYGPGGLRTYPAAGSAPRMGAEEVRTQKCPRCRKDYLSTINQRRCIASHLGASGGAKAARGVADPKQLAEFWDGLSEAERRAVMAVKEEHNGERTLRELSIQILHRKRAGVTDGLTKEQRRLHLAGKMLHDFVTGELPPGGSQLVSVLSQVSEGTFLFERNAINRDEVLSGNNLEAGLGALVTKRLVGAHLAAKQAAAAAMQEQLEREQEDQEAQQAAKKGKQQQQQQQGQGQAGAAKKQAKGSKAKGKAAAPAAKSGGKPAAAAAAAADAPAEPASSEGEAEAEQAGAAGRPPPLQLPANGKVASPQQAGDDELSPPSASGARYGASPQRASTGASQYTNFLFLAEEAAESTAAEEADGWRTAGSGRPSSRSSQAAGAKPSGSGSSSQANGSSKAGGRGTACTAAAAAAAPVRSSSRTADRQAVNGTAAAPAAAPKAAAPANGKLAQPPRSSTSAAAAAAPTSKQQQQKQQPQPSREESFPALPAAAAGKPRVAAAAAAAAPPGFSYAAAASKMRRDGSKQQAGEGKQPPEQKPTQQQQQPQQAESWPVPGPLPGKGAKPSAAAPAVAPAAAQHPAAEPAASPKQPEAAPAAEPPAAPEAPPAAAPEPAEAQPAAAAEAPEGAAAPAPAPAAAVEVQRGASVTPPISDAGSPPPGPLPLLPGFAVPPGGWVGPDGAPLMPPPLPPGYYWAALPAMPGMQFGNVDMTEVLPGGPWPYPPFYPPGAPPPYGLPPPGAMLPPGVPLPRHALPYGEDGLLAPFPPGMPVPLPPEAAEQLAAAAAAHAAAENEAAGVPGTAAPAEAAAAEEQAADASEAAAPEAAAPEAAPQPAEPAPPAAATRKGFLALLQDAYGPARAAQQPAAASRAHRNQSFDAAAAAAELQRRWQAAAPAAVPAQRPQVAAEAAPAAPRSASKGRPPSRGSSSGSLGSKSGKASALGGGSGRASPAGGPGKPVVVAVRAWSSDDSASDGPKWKIQAATQAQQAQQGSGGSAAQQQQQQ